MSIPGGLGLKEVKYSIVQVHEGNDLSTLLVWSISLPYFVSTTRHFLPGPSLQSTPLRTLLPFSFAQ